MLKELSSLLCSLFVPRRSVSGGGSIYGKRPSELGISDCKTGVITVKEDNTPTNGGKFVYVAPSDGIAWVYAERAIFVALKPEGNTTWPILVRYPSPGYNLSACLYFKKGQSVSYQYAFAESKVTCYFCPI